jgi:hypothetical protein
MRSSEITRDFASAVLEEIGTSRDQIAETMKRGHKSIILEADEWRPLADHIAGLMAMAYCAGHDAAEDEIADRMLKGVEGDEDSEC